MKTTRKEKIESLRKFDWNAKADPDRDSDNYFNGTVSADLGEDQARIVTEKIQEAFADDDARCQSDFINGAASVVAEVTGIPELSRRDMLLCFCAYKMGEVAQASSETNGALQLLRKLIS